MFFMGLKSEILVFNCLDCPSTCLFIILEVLLMESSAYELIFLLSNKPLMFIHDSIELNLAKNDFVIFFG